jgi:hypothetical protein
MHEHTETDSARRRMLLYSPGYKKQDFECRCMFVRTHTHTHTYIHTHTHIHTYTHKAENTWRLVLLYSPVDKKQDFEDMLKKCCDASATRWELIPMISATAGQVGKMCVCIYVSPFVCVYECTDSGDNSARPRPPVGLSQYVHIHACVAHIHACMNTYIHVYLLQGSDLGEILGDALLQCGQNDDVVFIGTDCTTVCARAHVFAGYVCMYVCMPSWNAMSLCGQSGHFVYIGTRVDVHICVCVHTSFYKKLQRTCQY